MKAVRFHVSHFLVNASVATANFGYIIDFVIISSSSIIIIITGTIININTEKEEGIH